MLCGIEDYDSGVYAFNGKDISLGNCKRIFEKYSIINQDNRLFDNLTVYENLKIVLKEKDNDDLIRLLLQKFDLTDKINEKVINLSRVFILGDKDQLPSVEVGAVFGDLIKWDKLINKNHIIRLDESIRFKKGTVIYDLAQVINNNTELPKIEFNDIFKSNKKGNDECNFKIKDVDKDTCPVYYYQNENCKEQKKNIEAVVKIWADKFYKDVQKDCTNIKLEKEVLDSVFDYTENAKILCAENEGIRGVRTLNNLIKKNVISVFIKKDNTKTPDEQSDKATTEKEYAISLSNQFAGQVMMINKNNKALNLYNGDTGLLVTIEGDDTLYFMVKKVMKRISQDGYKKRSAIKHILPHQKEALYYDGVKVTPPFGFYRI